MSVSQLAVVPSPTPESPAARASRLLSEARLAADEQVVALEEALVAVAHLAAEIAEGGEVYPVGVREISRHLMEDAVQKSQSLDQLLRARGQGKRGAS